MAWSYGGALAGYGWIDSIAAALSAQLAAQLTIPTDSVFMSLFSDEDHIEQPPADRFVVMRPRDFPVGAGADGGRLMTGFDSTWYFTSFTRYQSDQEFRNTRGLTDTTNGLLVQTLAVINALQDFVPLNASGAALVRQPMMLRGFNIREMTKRTSPWCIVSIPFNILFNVALTQ